MPRGRRQGGPFQVSKSPNEVLKYLRIPEGDVWWGKMKVGLSFPSLPPSNFSDVTMLMHLSSFPSL